MTSNIKELIGSLRELSEKATPGPWVPSKDAVERVGAYHPDWGKVWTTRDGHPSILIDCYRPWLVAPGEDAECRSLNYTEGGWHEPAQPAANAALISELRNALPTLLDALEASQSQGVDEAAVERVARALWDSLTLGPWSNLTPDMQEEWRRRARAAIAALPRSRGEERMREALDETILDMSIYTDLGIIRARAIERRAALTDPATEGKE